MQKAVNRYAAIVYGSSELNLLRLPFFQNGKDTLEDFDYSSPHGNLIRQTSAARTPNTYAQQPASRVSNNHFFNASILTKQISNSGSSHNSQIHISQTQDSDTRRLCSKLLNHAQSYLQQLNSTSTDSHKDTDNRIEASQLPPATKFTAGTPWNSNLYQVSNDQLNSNSTSKVLRSSSIIQLRILQSTSQLLNLARNHLPKIAQHPKNAPSDFSRNLRTPAASRSNSKVILQPLMGNNRKNKSQGFQRHQNCSNHRRRTATIGGN
ncbi:calcium-dependent protein kinase 8-like [Dorcoceras hygrometricum]|uniref:Calcium-dependent protein kinase 8-like n=1 Tax=Dorcoceras hygrometricum TaxID=472368 RepID=A0A2Z7APV5_9LAMI|nr:calcium-dependent protein kinase 8-like [Dorcoceras hygrometricum]